MRLLTATFMLLTIISPAGWAAVPGDCGVWPSEQPWQWTDEERLDHRFDDRCLEARRALAAQDGRRDGSCRASGRITDFVFGTDTPELFLPWQLFDTLLDRIFAGEPKFAHLQRQLIEERTRAANIVMPEDFWQRVENASVEYLTLLRQQRGAATKLGAASPAGRRALRSEIATSQRASCAARQAALARVRRELGPETFDRFLYVAVAPGLCSSGDSDRKMLSWVGRGCP